MSKTESFTMVFLYKNKLLTLEQRGYVEEAYQADPYVRACFERQGAVLDSLAEAQREKPLRPVDMDDVLRLSENPHDRAFFEERRAREQAAVPPGLAQKLQEFFEAPANAENGRRLAGKSSQRQGRQVPFTEAIATVLAFNKATATAAADEAAMVRLYDPDGVPAEEVIVGPHGTLLRRQPYLKIKVGAGKTPSDTPPGVPSIHVDYKTGIVTIMQRPKDVPSGMVEVYAVRRRGDNVQTFPSIPVPLKKAAGGRGFMYAELDLKCLVGDYRPGDDFIYCVEIVTEK